MHVILRVNVSAFKFKTSSKYQMSFIGPVIWHKNRQNKYLRCINTVNRFIFVALNFCNYGPYSLLRAFYICVRIAKTFLSKTKVEFSRSAQQNQSYGPNHDEILEH